MIEIKGGAPPAPEKTRKITRVKCKNPVLVVGHGPSFKNHMEGIRNWKHTLVATDVCLDDLLENNIIPDYVVTSEASRHTNALWGKDPKRLKDNNIKVRHSSIVRNDVLEANKKEGVDIELFDFEEEVRCSNVGLFALNFAVYELKADKIMMVGFEHTGDQYDPYVYQVWQTDFWYFVKKWPKQIIVNCSDGGALYFKDYTLESTLDVLKVEVN